MELFYNSKIDKNTTNFTISDEDFKHITRVMRKRKGDLIKFTNGKGYGFESQIERIEKKRIYFEIKKLFKTANSNNLHIGISLLKSSTRFEFFLEKATEIGIKEITPIISKNTLKKGINMLRSTNKIISAMKQSVKYYMPKINKLELFETFCNNSDEKYKFISTCQDIKKIPVSKLTKIQESTLVLIGPEGDFNKDEIDYAIKNEFEPLSLGNNRLRSETAAIVVSSAFSTFK
ncbi:16S rRNA (uracil(1498)-N(3))-methyltransferase [Flavobacteriales bacterium]|jgi:16S rRNA (uracil1498-N3)-methyltransferase|nr:16S rRNA (uracil(1498)-N(3))-methyltransferase [Flavobacteriales bacterium]|tara:strand:+ start:25 stop:723 length:699 start_codon:yes stop_codon:yes gene_type:complete